MAGPLSRKHYGSLQAGRAIAALLVVLFHDENAFCQKKYWGYDPSRGFFQFGHAGVEFFFVLSGFVILYVHWIDIDQPYRIGAYLRKRFQRIYLFYWMILAAMLGLYRLVPTLAEGYAKSVEIIIQSALLWHAGSQIPIYSNEKITVIAVAWTLYHEILFYVLFAILIVNKRLGLSVCGLWFLGSVVSLVAPSAFPASFYLSPLHLLFGMGMAACWLVRNRRIRSPFSLAVAGSLLFAACAMDENYSGLLPSYSRSLLYGLGSSVALLGVVTLEKQGHLSIAPFLCLIGDASYAIYLTHVQFISVIDKGLIFLGARQVLPAGVSFSMAAVLAVSFGVALHVLVERPMLRGLRSAARDNVPAGAGACSYSAPRA